MMFLHVSHTPGDHPYIPPFNPFLLQAAELLLHGRADVGAKSMDGQAPWMDDVFFEFLKDFFPWESPSFFAGCQNAAMLAAAEPQSQEIPKLWI